MKLLTLFQTRCGNVGITERIGGRIRRQGSIRLGENSQLTIDNPTSGRVLDERAITWDNGRSCHQRDNNGAILKSPGWPHCRDQSEGESPKRLNIILNPPRTQEYRFISPRGNVDRRTILCHRRDTQGRQVCQVRVQENISNGEWIGTVGNLKYQPFIQMTLIEATMRSEIKESMCLTGLTQNHDMTKKTAGLSSRARAIIDWHKIFGKVGSTVIPKRKLGPVFRDTTCLHCIYRGANSINIHLDNNSNYYWKTTFF